MKPSWFVSLRIKKMKEKSVARTSFLRTIGRKTYIFLCAATVFNHHETSVIAKHTGVVGLHVKSNHCKHFSRGEGLTQLATHYCGYPS